MSSPMPPVGTNPTPVPSAASALTIAGPPITDAGNSFTVRQPRAIARRSSVGVAIPGSARTPRRAQTATTSSTSPGDTTNRAPASIAASHAPAVVTVPAPTSASGTPAAAARSASRSGGRPERDLDGGEAAVDERPRHRDGGSCVRDGDDRHDTDGAQLVEDGIGLGGGRWHVNDCASCPLVRVG